MHFLNELMKFEIHTKFVLSMKLDKLVMVTIQFHNKIQALL
jgi:hypothetical protein